MPSPSKENNILLLILENSPLKEWHFEEIVRQAKVTRIVANKWLNKYVSQGLLQYVKPKGKFPYYTVGSNNPVYYAMKRIYALSQFHESGLIAKLLSLEEPKTIILFGSMIKGDWYTDSDIDVFVFGKISDFNRKLYEAKLGRHIELHIFETKKDIEEVRTGLIKNIIDGYVMKGSVQDFIEA
jgi:predicted nucleotidyltransferase